MKIEDLTLRQIKEIQSLKIDQGLSSNILKDAIGKYCIVRTRNEGVNAGIVIEADHTGVVIQDARRIYYHKPKDSSLSWYEGVAVSGLHKDSKISGTVFKKYIIEDYSLTVCTKEAEKSIRNHVCQGS